MGLHKQYVLSSYEHAPTNRDVRTYAVRNMGAALNNI